MGVGSLKEMNEKWLVVLKQHKQLLFQYIKTKDQKKMDLARLRGRQLCLHYCDYKCQICGTRDNLTLQHAIKRDAQRYMDFYRFITQRDYWANMSILCRKCHHTVDGNGGSHKTMLSMSKGFFKECYRLFGVEGLSVPKTENPRLGNPKEFFWDVEELLDGFEEKEQN